MGGIDWARRIELATSRPLRVPDTPSADPKSAQHDAFSAKGSFTSDHITFTSDRRFYKHDCRTMYMYKLRVTEQYNVSIDCTELTGTCTGTQSSVRWL